MTDTRSLRDMADEFRRYASETQIPSYAVLMLCAASDLERAIRQQESHQAQASDMNVQRYRVA